MAFAVCYFILFNRNIVIVDIHTISVNTNTRDQTFGSNCFAQFLFMWNITFTNVRYTRFCCGCGGIMMTWTIIQYTFSYGGSCDGSGSGSGETCFRFSFGGGYGSWFSSWSMYCLLWYRSIDPLWCNKLMFFVVAVSWRWRILEYVIMNLNSDAICGLFMYIIWKYRTSSCDQIFKEKKVCSLSTLQNSF